MARLGGTGRAALTYLLLAGLQRGILLLILPFISHVMLPAEYGAASTLTAAALLLTAIIASPLDSLIFRTVARHDDDSPAILRVVGAYCYFVLPIAAALIGGTVALALPSMLGIPGTIWGIELLAVGFQPAMTVFAITVVQARQDLRRFMWLAAASVSFIAISKFLLVVVWRLGVLGWALSDLVSGVLSAVMAIALVRPHRAVVTTQHIWTALRFAGPLVPHRASVWAVMSLSRPALAAVSTLTQVGLLSFGVNLASVATLILSEGNRAVLPRYSRENFQAPTHETLVPVRWQLIAAFVVPAVVGSGVAVAGRWIFAEAYWPSFAIAGILLIGQAAYGLYLIPINYLTQTAGLTKYSALASGAGAILIFVSILVLGRRFGAAGVSVATAAGYSLMAIVAMILVKTHKLDIKWRSWHVHWPEMALAVSALACSVGALASTVGSGRALTLSGASLALAIGAMALTFRRK